ncbi:NAD(P)/FAD-dependent oxidoreductase [Phreatobacter stygius]|uniref:NAD(P)/FAD-dependent oxidoreductase n=1 Tax=Phreatobacter stygius TaxID=1940610 RepID=A0A4D7BIF4_9HYPH|nr:FAD-dependent oxidoreductase [Phreatobacter stygius]QCI69458.1 NAD(P)/FAD-dependent oxidoreductase [Phreatobacter stygius]
MTQRILIVGAGFAGMWSALGAARLLDSQGKADGAIEIALIAPEPVLHVRPRLHEAGPAGMTAPLAALFEAAGIRYIQGRVERLYPETSSVEAVDAGGGRFTVAYDRLVLAAGSRLHRPDLPGLHEFAHSIDQLHEASALDAHLTRLAELPDTPARNTVVVVGGGFTGIEIAAELPARLRAALGATTGINVIVVEQAADIGPDLGPGPRPAIVEALDALGIVRRVGTTVTAIDAEGLTTSTGDHIAARTVIWTAGLRASPLTSEIDGQKDHLGRLHVAADLRVPGHDTVFATGDVAFALTDDQGHHALMSCQHATTMGRIAGHNVAADLIGLPTRPYRQLRYVTCLDLGAWGAVFSEGWDRRVTLVGAEAKAIKRMINTQRIYPPAADRKVALAAADPG